MLSKKKFKADHENVEDFILEPKKRDQFEGGSDAEEEKEDPRYNENQDEGPAREVDAYQMVLKKKKKESKVKEKQTSKQLDFDEQDNIIMRRLAMEQRKKQMKNF